jgi:hypothetical protein
MARASTWLPRAGTWAVLVAVTVLAAVRASDEQAYDLVIYRADAIGALAGTWSGWHRPSMYPVGLVPVTLPLRWANADTLATTWVFAVTLPVTLLMLLVLALARPGAGSGAGWRGLLTDTRVHAGLVVAACTVALDDWWLRYEPVVALAALLGLLAARAGRPLLAGGWLAAGFWLKGWPLVLALPAARAAGSRVLLALGVGVGGVALAAALLGGDHVWSFVTANDDRPPQPEALATLPVMLLRALGRHEWSLHLDTDIWAYVVTGPGVRTAATAVTLVMVLLAGAVSAGYLRHRRRGPAGWGDAEARVSTALVGLVVLASPVLSPQYLAWLVPVVAVAVLDGRQRAVAAVLVVACVLTSAVHPNDYDGLLNARPAPPVWLLARDLCLAGVVVGAGWPLVRPRRRAAAPPDTAVPAGQGQR